MHYRDECVRRAASLCVSGHAYSGSCLVERVFFSTPVLLGDVLDHAVNLDDGDGAVVGVGVVLVFIGGGGKRGGEVAANGHRDSFGRRGLRGTDCEDAVNNLGGDGGVVHVLGQRDGEGVTPADEAGGRVGARGERVLAIDLDGEVGGGNPGDRALDQGDHVAVDIVCVFVRVGVGGVVAGGRKTEGRGGHRHVHPSRARVNHANREQAVDAPRPDCRFGVGESEDATELAAAERARRAFDEEGLRGPLAGDGDVVPGKARDVDDDGV